jgi:hypothetical protein
LFCLIIDTMIKGYYLLFLLESSMIFNHWAFCNNETKFYGLFMIIKNDFNYFYKKI